MFKIKRIYLIALILIIFLGFFLRFYKLSSIPNGPEWDEASVGYNAFSIATTGHDEWGNKTPLIFKAFGDYKNPLYIYLTALVVKFIGLSIFSTRFINAFTGTLFILVWYLIAKLAVKDERFSLLTAFFIAISPFGIFFSRIAGDGMMLSVFLISLGIMFEILYLKKVNWWMFFLSILCLLLSIFSYNLARIISPVLILLILVLNFRNVKNKLVYLPILLLCGVFFFFLINQSGVSFKSRLQYVGIFGEEKGSVLQIKELREHDKNNLVSKVLHNKLTNTAITLSDAYIAYFSSQFLLGFNDNNLVYESHYPPLFLIMLPFFYVGIVIFIKDLFEKSESRIERILLLTLLFIAPIPAVIAEGVSGKRSLAMLGVMQFMSVYGLLFSWNQVKKLNKKKLVVNIFVILITVNLFHYLFFYFFTFPKEYGVYYASRENKICKFVKNNYDDYDYFIYSRQIDAFAYIFPLFCLSYSPNKYVVERSFSEKDGWSNINSFNKFIFPEKIDSNFIKDLPNKRIAIFLTESENKETVFDSVKSRRLPIASDAHNELYLYEIKKL